MEVNINIETFQPMPSLEELAKNLPQNNEQIFAPHMAFANKLTIIQSVNKYKCKIDLITKIFNIFIES